MIVCTTLFGLMKENLTLAAKRAQMIQEYFDNSIIDQVLSLPGAGKALILTLTKLNSLVLFELPN